MPRPGPRPYECVKRAWHSDRHQPIRGSIIQQIFRVVNEIHSSVTKKNKEWQEKLPTVVLKAEAIIYSKANSEVEYMDVETLWDRVNDAINTIIRREESTENRELLPPCVEAALNLGCIPVRASRSQRLINPRIYLSTRANEPASASPRISDETNAASSHDQFSTLRTNIPLNVGSAYPLYYGTNYQTEESRIYSGITENAKSNTIYFGTPIGTSFTEPADTGVQGHFSCAGAESASNRTMQAYFKDTYRKPLQRECDLSLRLGLFSDSCLGVKKGLACETEDGGLGRYSDLSQRKSKDFCFSPRSNFNPMESCSSGWFSKGAHQHLEATVGKYKAPFCTNVEDEQFFWQPEVSSNPLIGGINDPERNQ